MILRRLNDLHFSFIQFALLIKSLNILKTIQYTQVFLVYSQNALDYTVIFASKIFSLYKNLHFYFQHQELKITD